jgi:hypothetical protein
VRVRPGWVRSSRPRAARSSSASTARALGLGVPRTELRLQLARRDLVGPEQVLLLVSVRRKGEGSTGAATPGRGGRVHAVGADEEGCVRRSGDGAVAASITVLAWPVFAGREAVDGAGAQCDGGWGGAGEGAGGRQRW